MSVLNKEIILNTIKETKELNARIYIQVLDNLVEWIEKNQETNDDVLRCLILVNINFILYHTNLNREERLSSEYPHKKFYLHTIQKLLDERYNYLSNNNVGQGIIEEVDSFDKYIIRLKNKITISKEISDENIRIRKQFIENNIILFKSDYFTNKLDISRDIDDEIFQKINNFIETGILIDE